MNMKSSLNRMVRLKKFSVTPTNDFYPPFLLFSAPTILDQLTSLRFENIEKEARKISIMAEYFSRAKLLKSLETGFFVQDESNPTDAVIESISNLPNLEKLNLAVFQLLESELGAIVKLISQCIRSGVVCQYVDERTR